MCHDDDRVCKMTLAKKNTVKLIPQMKLVIEGRVKSTIYAILLEASEMCYKLISCKFKQCCWGSFQYKKVHTALSTYEKECTQNEIFCIFNPFAIIVAILSNIYKKYHNLLMV